MSITEVDEFCEQQRERLHAALATLIEWSHADSECPHDPLDCLEADYEETLKQIDVFTIRTNQPWHVGLAYMVRITETRVAQISEGDET